jgi:L,D-transpeptidase YcbB
VPTDRRELARKGFFAYSRRRGRPDEMGAASHNRRFLIAAAACLTIAAGGLALALFNPALGPIAGTVVPQLYVQSVAGAEIPARGRFVLVDAASARLYMIEDGRVRDSMRVIVGKPETPTPELKSVLNYETLNPYWHVTADLTKTLIAPRVLADGNAYLNERGYEVLSGWGPGARVLSPDSVDWKAVAAGTAQVFVRQRPGPANSLGHVKFDLPNGDGIYLHDTPKKELFAQDARNLSHGCVRLEDALRLARWLLGKDPPAVTAPEEHVPIPQPVPIAIKYLDQRSQTQLAALQ